MGPTLNLEFWKIGPWSRQTGIDFVIILGVFALLQTRFHLLFISVHFENEKIEVMRVCFIQGQKQQQNWVLEPGVLAPC